MIPRSVRSMIYSLRISSQKCLIGALTFLTTCLLLQNIPSFHKTSVLQRLAEGSGEDLSPDVYLEDPQALIIRDQLSPNASFSDIRRRFNNELWKSLFYRVDIEKIYRSAWEGGPMNYLAGYRNPCWREVLQGKQSYLHNGFWGEAHTALRQQAASLAEAYKQGQRWRMRCLPYIYLVGVTKSGTTDLYDNMVMHPDIICGMIKEPMWWNRFTLGNRFPIPFEDYLDLFDGAAHSIQVPAQATNKSLQYHGKITIDATPAYLWDYDGWQKIPGNRGLLEPRYILAHTLRQLTPQARIIAILRQPAERLYSQFRMRTGKSSPDKFHTSCEEVLVRMRQCLQNRTLRDCTYDDKISPYEKGGLYLRASLYYVFIQDWLDVFPRDQVLIIRAEDYYANRSQTLGDIWDFLDIPPLPPAVMSHVNIKKVSNAASQYHKRSTAPMLPETKLMLDDFYMPYNSMLAKLMNDDRYLWRDTI